MSAPVDLAALDRGKYVRLTTTKRDGTAVPTPVWFAVDGDRLYVWTDGASGKAKRIRNNPAVEVVPCDGRGSVKQGAATRTGTARLVDDDDVRRRAHDVLNRKYGLTKKGIELGNDLLRRLRRKPRGTEAIIEIALDPAG
jgi:PPOX class probable F420-dependent enzyme